MPVATQDKAFGAQDFISFDLGADQDDDVPQSSTQANRGRGSKSREEEASRKGKKRKADEREDDGRSKKERQMARSRHTPWSADVDWNKCKNGAEALHRELIAFDYWMAPTAAEHETRCMVIELISRAIKSQFRDAEVHPFGSQETKLYLPQGDLDLVVVSNSMANLRTQNALRTMAACLRRHNLATDVQVIAKAKVPIIKFVTTYARLKVDISLNHTNGLTTASYVNSWLRKWPHIRPLILVVKHLLMQRGMSEVFSGGLGSYSVIIMVISFLQLHPKVQRGEIEASRSLGVLLLEFLELYGKNFGYDNCGISVRGRGGYFSKARRGWKDERRPFMLCIEDPHDPSNDISKGSFGIINVRSTLAGAFDILTAAICQQANEGSAKMRLSARDANDSGRRKHRHFSVDSDSDSDAEARRALVRDSTAEGGKDDKDPNSLLGIILGISNPVVRQRKEMEELYFSGSLQFKLGRPAPPSSPPPARPSSSREDGLAARLSSSAAGSSGSTTKARPDSGVVSIDSAKNTTKRGQMPALSIRGAASAADKASGGSDADSQRGSKRARRSSPSQAGSDKDDAERTERRRPNAEADSEDEDSRYSASRSSKPKSSLARRGPDGAASPTVGGPAKKRARRGQTEITQADLEDLSHSAPSTFVSEDDSDDDAARGDDKMLLPTLSGASSVKSAPKLGSAGRGMSRISSRTKNDFWTAKGVDTGSGQASASPPPPRQDEEEGALH
ncbi:PAP/25A-associated [Kalmanozyma brasiliensis GHG001]|uniref:polynucleotide adenylyltransferase n=1 Tax=Kalmanozyma brasiliensis (strain GHG001) TaxID=1365824 RepID=V5E7G1_KALBG|nr:PAP/25A-associated [Kalmanozyma brasiliensis GHG001]EST06226.1 PAP/25A-associated [Kalmanozyma brasiliensis GHG001]